MFLAGLFFALFLQLSTVFCEVAVFSDVTGEAGIRFKHESGLSRDKLIVETVGSGLAWIDFDNDGWQDLYLVNGSVVARGQASPGNMLLRNNQRGGFEDVTARAGVGGKGAYGMGVAVADYDADGWMDFYVTNYGPNLLFHNNGNGTFDEVGRKAGVDSHEWGSSAGFFDYDLDGDLDLYVVNYLGYVPSDDRYCGRREEGYRLYCDVRSFDGAADQLYRNNGDGTFADISKSAGIANPAGKGLGLVFQDFDLDGQIDVYVANDTVRDFLYQNRGDGTFKDVTFESGLGYDPGGNPQAGMGVDSTDLNGDGFPEIVVTNFAYEYNFLFENRGHLLFENISERGDLGSGLLPMGFGVRFLDYDNDGDMDLYIANGHIENQIQLYFPQLSFAQKDLLYENRGGTFYDVSREAGSAFQLEKVGRGAAVGDYDNDGDVDIVVSNSGETPNLLRNDAGSRNHWITLITRGSQSNSPGFGARVQVETAQTRQWQTVSPVSSYLSSSDPRLHFGLGSETRIKRISVLWPSGIRQELSDVPSDQILLVEEPDKRLAPKD